MSTATAPILNGMFLRHIDEALARPRPIAPPDPDRAMARLVSLIDSDPRGPVRVAADSGVDRRQLQRIRSGEAGTMMLLNVAAILAALGRSWRDLDG